MTEEIEDTNEIVRENRKVLKNMIAIKIANCKNCGTELSVKEIHKLQDDIRILETQIEKAREQIYEKDEKLRIIFNGFCDGYCQDSYDNDFGDR